MTYFVIVGVIDLLLLALLGLAACMLSSQMPREEEARNNHEKP